VRSLLDRHGLTQVLFNLPSRQLGCRREGIACHSDRVGEFRDSIDTAIATGCVQVNCLAGILPKGQRRIALERVLIDNLGVAAQRLADCGIGPTCPKLSRWSNGREQSAGDQRAKLLFAKGPRARRGTTTPDLGALRDPSIPLSVPSLLKPYHCSFFALWLSRSLPPTDNIGQSNSGGLRDTDRKSHWEPVDRAGLAEIEYRLLVRG
jgi:hypothetical protein